MDFNENNIPNELPVNGHDRFEYFLKYLSSNIQIQAVITFNQYLDADILKTAVRLSLDAEPVLGCRFVEDEKKPCWQRFESPDEIQWFEFIHNDNKEEAVEQFLRSPFTHADQQVNVQLIRTQYEDVLCIKISHACSDAAGLKQYLQLLATIYSKLQENSGFQPRPNIQARRDQKNYFDALGIQEPLALFDPQAQKPPPTWAFPYHGSERKGTHITICRFADEALERIQTFGKTHKVTINTIILTVFYRCMFELIKPEVGEDMEICISIDLRRALTGSPAQAICNLSVGLYPRIPRVEDESFIETLKRVSGAIEELKSTRAELSDAVTMEVFGHIDYSKAVGVLQWFWQQALETGNSSPLLSNMGVINALQFGQIAANDAYLVAPITNAPGFVMGVSTYHRTLTLEVSLYEPSHRKEEVEALMEMMKKELNSL
ncbi:MAG: condensation domain-containing protein [Syntrophomonadaceae bacterium]|nr:condensation domain-containing protein [Syntrophomonadaceae bacterium]